MRRLSGSELGSTSFLLGNGSSNESRSRLVLRPLSVQERIRELNLRARHFAETVMAVQLHDTVSVGKIVWNLKFCWPVKKYRNSIYDSISRKIVLKSLLPTWTLRMCLQILHLYSLRPSWMEWICFFKSTAWRITVCNLGDLYDLCECVSSNFLCE